MKARRESADTFDYVIVGSGAAGCVLANRLSADGKATVCLLESGPRDRNLFIHIPGGFIKIAYRRAYVWPFETEPSEHVAGRRVAITHGRTLGGSTSINGFNYVRGQREDYDGWAAMGNPGWGYADVLAYFKRSESRIGKADPRYRGTDGPLPITDCDWRHPLCDAFIAGAHELGVAENPDYNAERQEGAGYYQRWIHQGRRYSAAKAFLKPAMARRNLEVRTNAQATRILVEGDRAVGVAYAAAKGGPARELRARRDVVLSAGAANSPKLLMLSGIGPARHLAEMGIGIVRDLPAVGAHLQDHFMVRSVARVKGVATLNETARGLRLIPEIARWALRRPSILTISPSVAYAFWTSREGLNRPDLQFHFSPGSYKDGRAGMLDDFSGMTLGFYQLRPESEGSVRLRSPDPFADPLIQPNYLAAQGDRRVVVDALRRARRLLGSAPLTRFTDRLEFPPATAVSEEDLLDFARRRGGTAWHLMGTCRMGPASDPSCVVDGELRPRGMRGLRVVDASIMPAMPSGNTQSPTMMIAEKAADMILGRPAPPAEDPMREKRQLEPS